MLRVILLQLSSGQGPLECAQAVGLALKAIQKQCVASGCTLNVVDSASCKEPDCFKSIVLHIDSGQDLSRARELAMQWQGAMLWVCQSQVRPKHRRKNWFFSGRMFEVNIEDIDSNIRFQACKASGAGGQHVNTTDSAIRATHLSSGISVKVSSERSQHANKRLAYALLMHKLEAENAKQLTHHEQQRCNNIGNLSAVIP